MSPEQSFEFELHVVNEPLLVDEVPDLNVRVAPRVGTGLVYVGTAGRLLLTIWIVVEVVPLILPQVVEVFKQ